MEIESESFDNFSKVSLLISNIALVVFTLVIFFITMKKQKHHYLTKKTRKTIGDVI